MSRSFFDNSYKFLLVKNIRFIIVLLASLLSAAAVAQLPGAFGQQRKPVQWQVSVRMTSAIEGKVIIKATMRSGWHLYGLELPQGGPRATSFDLSGSRGVEYTGPVVAARAPLEVQDPVFGMTLTWWDEPVTFSAPFVVTGSGLPVVAGTISYMACDGSNCMPPSTESFSVNVTPAAQ